MRKTLFSILPLVVLFVPTISRLPFLGGGVPRLAETETAASSVSPEMAAWDAIQSKLKTAKQMLEREAPQTTDFVTLAVEDATNSQVHLLKLAKTAFLNKDAETLVRSSLGETFRLQPVRPNYVNTAVRVLDAAGRELQPLLVQYPIEKNGSLKEVAYYSSAHPALGSPDLVQAGSGYVHRVLNEAAAELASQGKHISPDIINVAERLCVVEHTDHKRFKTEDHAALYDEIYTLYALNSRDTYRYSVSSAGAGGMIQMIPPTYKAIRERYPQMGLKEDFVEGMRDHENAAKAMLLYMQDTWNDLLKKEEVRQALASGIATQADLLAAGYNSNPMRLHTYIGRGGAEWRTFIPEETKIYLRIYASVESLVDFKNRS